MRSPSAAAPGNRQPLFPWRTRRAGAASPPGRCCMNTLWGWGRASWAGCGPDVRRGGQTLIMGYSADKSPLIGHLAGPLRRLEPLGAQRQEKCGPNRPTPHRVFMQQRRRGVRRSSSHRPGRRTSLATARGRPRGIGTITWVKQLGRRRWKKVSGYHRQSRVENAFFRYKSIIGDGLRARSPAGQGSEVVLGCEILNRMTALGRPASYRIGR